VADGRAERRVVDRGGAVGAEIGDLVPLGGQPLDELVLQRDAVVVGRYDDPHG
jgi:hypothetical protein